MATSWNTGPSWILLSAVGQEPAMPPEAHEALSAFCDLAADSVPKPGPGTQSRASLILKPDLDEEAYPGSGAATLPLIKGLAAALSTGAHKPLPLSFALSVADGPANLAWPLWRQLRGRLFGSIKGAFSGKPYHELRDSYEAIMELRTFREALALSHPVTGEPLIEASELATLGILDEDGKLGYRPWAEGAGIGLRFLELEPYRLVPTPLSAFLDEAPLAVAALQAAGLISVAKVTKPEDVGGFRGALANLFSLVPAAWRQPYLKTAALAGRTQALYADVVSALPYRPWAASLLEGPVKSVSTSSGGPCLLIMSNDCVAHDAAAASLMGFEPLGVAAVREAHFGGLGQGDLDRVGFPAYSLTEARRHLHGEVA